MRATGLAAAAAALCCDHAVARGEFVPVGSALEDGIQISTIDPDISETGEVVFIGGSDRERLYLGSEEAPASLTEIDLSALGLTDASAAQIEAAWVVFNARRLGPDTRIRGIYALSLEDGELRALLEGCVFGCAPGEPSGPPPSYARSLDLSPNGTVAFSTLSNGRGAVYRGYADASVSQLQSGSQSGGYLYNTIGVAVNDQGRVAVQSEYYAPPFSILRRGLFVFVAPHEPVAWVRTVLHDQPVSSQPQPSFLPANRVAYGFEGALYQAPALPYLLHADGAPVGPEVLADTLGAFTAFQRRSGDTRFMLTASEAGPFAFEAILDDGRHGVFRGPAPALAPVLSEGDPLLGGVAREVYLGEVNGTGQIVLRVVVERCTELDTLIVRFDPTPPCAATSHL